MNWKDFFHQIIDAAEGDVKTIKFLMPWKSNDEDWYKYMKAVIEIEIETGWRYRFVNNSDWRRFVRSK